MSLLATRTGDPVGQGRKGFSYAVRHKAISQMNKKRVDRLTGRVADCFPNVPIHDLFVGITSGCLLLFRIQPAAVLSFLPAFLVK